MNKVKFNKFLSNLMTLIMIVSTTLSTISFTYASGTGSGGDPVEDILKEVLEVLLVIAGLLCVGKIIHIGILFMTSSAADKSNAKQALLPWIIGTIVCFGAAAIGGAIINLFKVDKPVLEY